MTFKSHFTITNLSESNVSKNAAHITYNMQLTLQKHLGGISFYTLYSNCTIVQRHLSISHKMSRITVQDKDVVSKGG